MIIRKGFAQHMINLGITITRDINPKIERIKFEDNSHFMCSLPNNTKYKVSMREFHIAFHGSTWYEYYFDAFLKKNHEIYLKGKENMFNPKYKPDEFDFVNEDLKEILTPIYNSVETWNDFFQIIQSKFGNKKCAIVYPWINMALRVIFDSTIYLDPVWIIDLKANEEKNKTRPVDFKSYEVVRKGGRYTRKKPKSKSIYIPFYHIKLPYPQIMALNYKRFLRDYKV